jgi:hypothetical protein
MELLVSQCMDQLDITTINMCSNSGGGSRGRDCSSSDGGGGGQKATENLSFLNISPSDDYGGYVE